MMLKINFKRIKKKILYAIVACGLIYGGAHFTKVQMQSSYQGDRKPYLQLLGQHSVSILWNTSQPD